MDAIAAKTGMFEDASYDYTVAMTRKLFHLSLMFKPGYYQINYHIPDEDGDTLRNYGTLKTQQILIEDECKGCLGCYRCDGFANCRPVPENYMELKRLIGDYLLLGLALLSLACWPTIKRSR